MRVDGKAIAEEILTNLKTKVSTLKNRGVTPTLAVILIGDDPGSLSYIKQKQKACDTIGAKLVFEQLPQSITPDILAAKISQYNADTTIHGLIIQRPIPTVVGEVQDILKTVTPAKDIDGFLSNSAYQVPVARAVITILSGIHEDLYQKNFIQDHFEPWLRTQSIAIIGRGETAGRPIAAQLQRYGCATSIVHSQTSDPTAILHAASIIVSCVGKRGVITKSRIKPGVILISVGLWRDTEGKLHGDYEENAIKNRASFYTPTPGGVGPVNVACLMQNLVEACILQTGGRTV